MAQTIIINGQIYEETGSNSVIVSGAIFQGGEAAFAVIDVDTDESVYDGQTGVVCTLSGSGISASGKRIFIVQGGTWVEQSVTAEDATSATITVNYDSHTAGAADLYAWDPV